MSFFKKCLPLAAVALCLTLLITACSPENGEQIKAGDDIKVYDGVAFDWDNAFFDDFTGGVTAENWYIGKQSWGTSGGGNGGVIPENVNYTDDGVLMLTGNGKYYTLGDVTGVGPIKDGSLTGGALISKFLTGPGRYETKMKILPRLGACSAFWTYAYDTANGANHEIDIELPGGKSAGVVSFENVLNTNYNTVVENQSQDVNVSELTNGKITALNDGQWHTYGFDWYTDPELVVYYIDGKVTAISDIFVPFMQCRLWLGVWFPNNTAFVGDAEFETDCMYVDWVKYVPFASQPYTPYVPSVDVSKMASANEYPSSPVSSVAVNKVGNGNFEYLNDKQPDGYGWERELRLLSAAEEKELYEKFRAEIMSDPVNVGLTESELNRLACGKIDEIYGNADIEDMCVFGKGIGTENTCGIKISGIGLAEQKIDGIYAGYTLTLSFSLKGKGKFALNFAGAMDSDFISCEEKQADTENWQTYSFTVTAPVGTKQIFIDISSAYGGTIFADNIILNVV